MDFTSALVTASIGLTRPFSLLPSLDLVLEAPVMNSLIYLSVFAGGLDWRALTSAVLLERQEYYGSIMQCHLNEALTSSRHTIDFFFATHHWFRSMKKKQRLNPP